MVSTSRSIGRRLMLGALGGAAFGVLLWAAVASATALTGMVLGDVPLLVATGIGALAGLGAAGGFMLARPTHARRAWVWWALGLVPVGLFYGALLSVEVANGRGLAERIGAIAALVILILAMVSAALVIGYSVASMHGGNKVSRGAFAIIAGALCGSAAGLGFGLASLVTLRPCQPHQYCLEPDPTRILQGGLVIGAILGLLLGVAVAVSLALAASAAQRAGTDFQIPHTNGVAGA